ncbi:MAG: hypothetical protein ACFFDT_14765, partial [Candidatus Hodarchaeota archaeon]
TICKLFSTQEPEGLTYNYYKDGFGTVWSMIFDVKEKQIDVCFGPPTHNKWYHLTLDGFKETREIPVVFQVNNDPLSL